MYALRRETEKLLERAGDFPAVERNARRLEACIRTLELNLGLIPPDPGPTSATPGPDASGPA